MSSAASGVSQPKNQLSLWSEEWELFYGQRTEKTLIIQNGTIDVIDKKLLTRWQAFQRSIGLGAAGIFNLQSMVERTAKNQIQLLAQLKRKELDQICAGKIGDLSYKDSFESLTLLKKINDVTAMKDDAIQKMLFVTAPYTSPDVSSRLIFIIALILSIIETPGIIWRKLTSSEFNPSTAHKALYSHYREAVHLWQAKTENGSGIRLVHYHYVFDYNSFEVRKSKVGALTSYPVATLHISKQNARLTNSNLDEVTPQDKREAKAVLIRLFNTLKTKISSPPDFKLDDDLSCSFTKPEICENGAEKVQQQQQIDEVLENKSYHHLSLPFPTLKEALVLLQPPVI